MRQTFFSVLSAAVYLLIGLILAGATKYSVPLALGGSEFSSGMVWAMAGIAFIMAYFSLVHLRHK